VNHESIAAASLSAKDAYRLMTDLVAPRPIAWVATIGPDGRGNIAPFSYFQAVSSRPPMVMLAIAWHADGRPKHTLRNILASLEFTVSHVNEALANAMNRTSADCSDDISEWDLAGEHGHALASAPAVVVAPPRVRDSLAAMECRLVHALPLGSGPRGAPSTTLVIGEVVCFTIAEGLLEKDEAGHLQSIPPARLAAVGRLGGIAYTKTVQTFELPRPKASSK
jgi:flavin reductase (DIM6/NTAB) family NADH-FMN oxidoreductase RutF